MLRDQRVEGMMERTAGVGHRRGGTWMKEQVGGREHVRQHLKNHTDGFSSLTTNGASYMLQQRQRVPYVFGLTSYLQGSCCFTVIPAWNKLDELPITVHVLSL